MKRGDISGDGMGAHVRPETIRLVADSVGLSTLAPEVAAVLAPEVEYRMREIIQVNRNRFIDNYERVFFCKTSGCLG